jgi:Glycosyl transferase family 2
MARPTRAVVTMAQNEAFFLPIWWHYYSRFFATDDIYILDHETTDGSTSGGGFVRVPVSHPVLDMGWMRDRMQEQQHALKRRYDVVLCTDADEIVAPDPAIGTLGDYIDRFEDDFVNCRGYELIHLKDREPPFDPSRSVLEQRSHWFHNPAYSKPLLARVPMAWHGGFHQRTDGQVNEDPQLYLIHLHRVDFATCLHRHRQRVSRPWNQRDLDEGWGYQNRIVEDAQFEGWFYNDSCSGVPITIERVPDHWRGLF